ncbi:hypothetical protein [Micromonospora echinofusca]|uniref:Lipoprotein n=1 Tax=Micromonospora echinofusca TaxID=47858 RepID=A0ABS3VS45_MICEH|nr:hypothetical protein [Micromonospora echinofusca]MBO4207354.1 hypothetical protein [Micromonospora echinofusca]
MQLTPRRAVPPLLTLVVAAMLTTGCADREATGMPEPDPTPSAVTSGPADPPTAAPVAPSGRVTPPSVPTDPPGRRPPTAPPKNPTDTRPTGIVVGHVTRGGSGPCYGVVTDDGQEYALYGPEAGTFTTGTRVRVTTAPLLLRISCGRGTHAAIVKMEPVG